MAAWRDVEQAEAEFAARVRRLFDVGRHKTIATLRADGAPRISGIECEFADGELRFGSMPGARKGADLRRDPRFALHGPASHPQEGKEAEWPGEAKIAGRFPISGPSVSRHLGVLKAAGLIRERRAANRIFYSLVKERLALCVSRFLSAVCPEQFVLRQRARGTLRNGSTA